MTRKVRIVRKRFTWVQNVFQVTRVFEILLGIGGRHLREAARDEVTAARLRKLEADTALASLRQQKVSNDVVLGDLEIEKRRRALGIVDQPFADPN